MIAINDEPETTLCFQNVIMFDISEAEVKVILNLVQEECLEALLSYLADQSIIYPIAYMLNDMKKQSLHVKQCRKLLKLIDTSDEI